MDQFKDFPVTLTSPAVHATAVTPNDAQPLPHISRALYIGQSGDITLDMQGGQTMTFQNVQAGSILALRASLVHQTGTTALGIIALW